MTTPSPALTREEIAAFGRALDELRRDTLADLGQADVDHIRRVLRAARYAEAGGRLLLAVGFDPVTFTLGVASLAVAKILENMEIGHNVMHGQYDWTRDPALDSQRYEWDIVCAADDWRMTHNHEHHTYTNVVGKDRDLGYGLFRLGTETRWQPIYLAQPIYALALAFFFQWGVAAQGMRLEDLVAGRQTLRETAGRARPFVVKAAWQLAREYLFFPALALANAPRVVAGNLAANGIRNLWTFAIIFCGHFPSECQVFRRDETVAEERGDWYLRQASGSANIEGGRWFHILSGHLSHQIEHHLFPDLPAARYPELAPRVRALCERFGQRYVTGSFGRQLASVARRILRHALPGGRSHTRVTTNERRALSAAPAS